jgi:hypothetical protein
VVDASITLAPSVGVHEVEMVDAYQRSSLGTQVPEYPYSAPALPRADFQHSRRTCRESPTEIVPRGNVMGKPILGRGILELFLVRLRACHCLIMVDPSSVYASGIRHDLVILTEVSVQTRGENEMAR